MAIFNEFRLIGNCYGDARRKGTPTSYKTYFTIVANGTVQEKRNFVPIIATGELAEKAHFMCRNGNKIAVSGEILTFEINNFATGLLDVKVYFIARDIILVEKVRRTELNEMRAADLIAKMPIEYGGDDK